jgi:hypothetical protein
VTDARGPLSGAAARALASGVLARVAVAEGTVDDLLARVEDGIREITTIADRAEDEIDRLSVLRMNGSLRLLAGPPPEDREPGGPVLGLAAWDGTLYYDEQHVTGPLREMFAARGVRRDQATLRRYRYALSEMLLQNSHLLSAGGTSYADSAGAFADPAVRLLELGVTEAWTARHLDEYIDQLQVEPVAPGIKEVQLPVSYPAYVPAVEELTAGIGQRVGLGPDHILRRLNSVTPAGKAAEAATLLLGASGLADVVPPGERSTVTDAVAHALQAPLFVMATFDTGDAGEPAIQAASATAGQQALEAAEAEVAAIRSRSAG